MRPKNSDFEGDSEFTMFEAMIENKAIKEATKRSYRANYRKLRNLLGKNIRDTAEDTTVNAINAAVGEQINSAQALLNIAILCRRNMEPALPVDTIILKRTDNKDEVTEMLKQTNSHMTLPSLAEYDAYLELLWTKGKYRDYIVNYLMRHHYTRNMDLIFDIVSTKKETLEDLSKNYLWHDRKNLRVVYIRNNYKTFRTYGQKMVVIDNERFLYAVKKCEKQMHCFPLTLDEQLIGYYVKQISYNQLGEGALLKIIVKHYINDYGRLLEISKSRGTNLKVLMSSYNITFNNDDNNVLA